MVNLLKLVIGVGVVFKMYELDADLLEFFFYNYITQNFKHLKNKDFYDRMSEKLYKPEYEEIDRTALEQIKNIFKLSLWQKLQLMINGYVFITYAKRKNWRDFMPFYVVKCSKHKILFFDYPHGYNEVFYCPLCEEEHKQKTVNNKHEILL